MIIECRTTQEKERMDRCLSSAYDCVGAVTHRDYFYIDKADDDYEEDEDEDTGHGHGDGDEENYKHRVF